jgi:hypothetical protein
MQLASDKVFVGVDAGRKSSLCNLLLCWHMSWGKEEEEFLTSIVSLFNPSSKESDPESEQDADSMKETWLNDDITKQEGRTL